MKVIKTLLYQEILKWYLWWLFRTYLVSFGDTFLNMAIALDSICNSLLVLFGIAFGSPLIRLECYNLIDFFFLFLCFLFNCFGVLRFSFLYKPKTRRNCLSSLQFCGATLLVFCNPKRFFPSQAGPKIVYRVYNNFFEKILIVQL